MRGRRVGILVALVACAVVLTAGGALGQGSATGTQYVTFWRGDLRIIATEPDTQVTLIDVETGAALSKNDYDSNFNKNPFTLVNPGDSFEGDNQGATFRVRIVAEPARGTGTRETPVIVFTGMLSSGLKHPPDPPSSSNAWMSYLPALAPGSVENGTEIGREFWGFVTREMYVFVRPGSEPTSVVEETDCWLVSFTRKEPVYRLWGFEQVVRHSDQQIHMSINKQDLKGQWGKWCK